MNTIKSFNASLNQLNPHRFEQWKPYRDQLTKTIIASLNDTKDDILIIGAGNSDDIDLEQLKDHCQKIYLSDIDDQALSHAVQKYHLENVSLLPAEYSGLAGHIEWKDFVTEACHITKDKHVRLLMKTYKKLILKHTFLPNYERQFKTIIVSPIYTQLLFQQLQVNLKTLEKLNYSMYLINLIRQSFLNLMSILIDTFNKNLIKLLDENGKIIIVSDIFETKNGSDFLKEIKPIINDTPQMEHFYRRYQIDYGTGLGDYGLQNMSKKLTPKQSSWMIWPFTEKRMMILKTVTFTKS